MLSIPIRKFKMTNSPRISLISFQNYAALVPVLFVFALILMIAGCGSSSSAPEISKDGVVIGVPDEARGLVVKAYLISKRNGQGFEQELKEFVKKRLSAHEFPRVIEFMDELPKTPAGKVNRNALKADYGAGKD